MTDNCLKIIVDLNCGTAFSGISYITNEVSIAKIEVINQ